MFIRFPISKLVPAVVLSLVLGLPAVVSADTITVCWDGSGDYLTIQEGIDAASDGDEVVVCDGVYTGPGNKNLDFGGKAITVRSAGGAENCIIDCEADGRGFHFHSGETAASVLEGFTITHGDGGDYPWGGAGVYCDKSSPTIADCIIIGNVSDWDGGGVNCDESNPVITDCTIAENTGSEGGGIYCRESSPAIIGCTIMGNLAEWGEGGGIACSRSAPTISGCWITSNVVDGTFASGGGIYCAWESDATISGCWVSGNVAAGDLARGGGIACRFSQLTLSNCTISENAAEWAGGGVSCESTGDWGITNCIIVANAATGPNGHGGGLYCDGGHPTISNCAIRANTATAVGGVL